MRLLELFEQITTRRQEEMEKDFTCGACAYLALTLNQKFGWPLVGILTGSGDDHWDEEENVVHIWVEPPGFSKAVDITGVHDIGPFTKEWSDAGADFDGEYKYDIRPEWVRDLIRRGRRYFPSKDRMFYPDEDYTDQRAWQRHHQSTLKQAYRALELLIPQFVQHGFINKSSLIEDQAIRTYDSGVIEWIQEALQRPDADQLYLHGSRQEQDVFDPKSKSHKLALLHFSKLTDPWFAKRNVPYQAEYYGPKLWLVKLNFKKPFDVRYPDSEAAQMQDELVPNHSQHRMNYEELYEITGPALERGYDMFVVFERAAGTESYAVPDHKQVQVVDIYDARERKRAVNESMANQLISGKLARKFTYVAMGIKFNKEQSTMVNMIERAADEFVDGVKAGNYDKLEDAEHDRKILLDMISRVSDRLYLHDEIRKNSKTAQILAGGLDLARIGSFHASEEPVDGADSVNMPTLS